MTPMSVDEMREVLRSPRLTPGQARDVAHTLRALAGGGIDRAALRELVLRALDRRACFAGVAPVLDGLVRTVGLFPYLSPDAHRARDLAAHEPVCRIDVGGVEVVLHRAQAEVYRALLAGRSVILSAPTSFGKSLIVDALVATGKFRNVVIVVPTIALIDETRRRLARLRRRYKIITHGSQRRARRNIFVLTPERVVESGALGNVEFFVIDEFYKLHPEWNPPRSATLNHALYRLLAGGAQFYMAGPDIKGIPEGFPERFRCTFIRTDDATVVSETHRLPRCADRDRQLVELCRTLRDPTLVYCASPARATKVVSLLADAPFTRIRPPLRGAAQWIGGAFHPDWQLARGLARGIGLHHGRVPRSIGQFVVRAFNDGLLQFLVCTSTLIEGVNTRAKNVVLFDGRIATRKLDYFTYSNIRGRSGRMSHHFVGHVYLFDPPPREDLPLVDIPMFTQAESAPESLLVQIDDRDLREPARRRLRPILGQSHLALGVIRRNAGIAPAAQIRLAREIGERAQHYHRLLAWSGSPSYLQLEAACRLIWEYLVEGRGRAGGVSSGRQLAFRIHRLGQLRHAGALIEAELGRRGMDPGRAVEAVLEFLRYWASYHFPRYLTCLERIQRSVFERRGLAHGDYGAFRSSVECQFQDPALAALEEYGVPGEVSRKLEDVLEPDGNLDAVLERLRGVDVAGLGLDGFEARLLEDAKRHL